MRECAYLTKLPRQWLTAWTQPRSHNILVFHVKSSMDPAVLITDEQNKHMRAWLLHRDTAIARSVAFALGLDGLDAMAAHFVENDGDPVSAARAKWCKHLLTELWGGVGFLAESRALLA